MIDEKKLAKLRKNQLSFPNAPGMVFEIDDMLDTIKSLWKENAKLRAVAEAAKLLDEREPKISSICGIHQALAALNETKKGEPK